MKNIEAIHFTETEILPYFSHKSLSFLIFGSLL